MAGATSKLDILITAKNEASSTLRQVATDAGGLESAFTKIGAGLAAGLTVQAVAQLAETGFEMARASAEADRLATSFEGLAKSAGQSSEEMMSAMREASQGTISDSELMLSANKAMMLGVADSAEEMSQLLEIAAARGKAMGESTSQAFSDLVVGLGRQSVLILDNLGITVDAAAANEAYAESLGKQSDQLSEAEKKQALLNAVIADSTDIVRENEAAGRDAAANFERMDASIQNAKDALGTLFEPAMVVVAQAIADAAIAATTEMKALTAESVEQRTDFAILDQATIGLTNDIGQLEQGMKRLEAAGQTGSEQYKQAQAELARLKAELAATKAAHDALIPSIELAAQDFTSMSMSADEARRAIAAAGGAAEEAGPKFVNMGADAMAAMEQFNIAMQESQGITQEIESAARSAGAYIAGKAGGEAGLAHQQEMTDELNAQKQIWRDQLYTDKEINEVLLPGMISQMNEADRAAYKTATHTAKISDEAKEAQKAFNDLESAVSGVLQGALDVGVGVDPQDILEKLGFPREDAINENARGLADIAANGLKDQDWLGEFKNEVPDIWNMIRLAQNPQEEAARLLQDFQDGLLTSPIDKEKAKEIVKRSILGDQNMAALATEIATELAAEMGIPMQEALAAAQGTLGGGKGMGSEAATTFSEDALAAMEDEDGGGSFVSTFVDQARAKYSLLATAGTDAARTWGDAFLAKVGDSVPPALINLLTDLVTPEVVARMNQRGTLTGATP